MAIFDLFRKKEKKQSESVLVSNGRTESLEFITPVEACKKYFGNNFYNNLRINKALREKYGFVLPNGRISAEEIALLTENEDSGLKGNKTKFTEDGNLI